jgi:hypothetical protein
MVAMQVTDEDMLNPLKMYMQPPECHLGAFAAVNQQQFFTMHQQLGGRIPLRCWNC